jgi:hypothetical protein
LPTDFGASQSLHIEISLLRDGNMFEIVYFPKGKRKKENNID